MAHQIEFEEVVLDYADKICKAWLSSESDPMDSVEVEEIVDIIGNYLDWKMGNITDEDYSSHGLPGFCRG